MHSCTEHRFLCDVENHEMLVIRNDGVNRHLRFKQKGTRAYCFDLITWSGYLCVAGDCGTYVFSRVDDMFTFFRSRDGGTIWPKGNNLLAINDGYWYEKVLAEDRNGGCKKYSEEAFREAVKYDFDSYFESYDDDWKDECWIEIEEQVLTAENEQEAFDKAMSFEFESFSFSDFWEHDLREYTFHFIWCLYAIVWGILKFDEMNH